MRLGVTTTTGTAQVLRYEPGGLAELDFDGQLRQRTRVNGEVVQNASTSEMIFSVAELLAFCSRSFTLEPSDVLLTGTPWGCGEFMDPPRSLRPGDVVEAETEGIGTLSDPVVDRDGAR